MCGRITVTVEPNEIAEWLEVDPGRIFEPRYNIAPTQWAPVVRMRFDNHTREAVPLRWGLLPPWATEIATGNMMINARAETLYQKTSFRNAIQRKRCIVPVTGFYEWQREGKKRKAFLVRHPENRPFALAGLWEFNEAVPEGPVETFTIITTSANKTMQQIHDRMPVILPDAELARWLNPNVDGAGVKDLLTPAAEGVLVLNRVSDYVNNANHEGPQCIAPPSAEESLAEEAPAVAVKKKPKGKDAPGQGMLFG